jgi:hypothetical protein
VVADSGSNSPRDPDTKKTEKQGPFKQKIAQKGCSQDSAQTSTFEESLTVVLFIIFDGAPWLRQNCARPATAIDFFQQSIAQGLLN